MRFNQQDVRARRTHMISGGHSSSMNDATGRRCFEGALADDRHSGPLRRPELISIVIPVYNEGENVDAVCASIAEHVAKWNYEILFVDDGSRDDTFQRIATQAKRDTRVRGLAFSRNFGHQQALAAGLVFAKGDVVITMDGDMQHPPSVLPQLVERWCRGVSVVHTRRLDSQDVRRFKRVTSKLFYRVFSALCGVSLSSGTADFRLLDRKVVNEINELRLNRVFLRGMIPWMGFDSAIVEYMPHDRFSGHTKYSVRKMLCLAIDGILSFSTVPFMIALWAAVITSLMSLVELAYVLVAWARGRTVPGWASITSILVFLFSIMFFVLAIQGQYIYRLYDQVHKPPYVVDRTTP
jgi:glycosyltransferase involved in cell wall biosynthesis